MLRWLVIYTGLMYMGRMYTGRMYMDDIYKKTYRQNVKQPVLIFVLIHK